MFNTSDVGFGYIIKSGTLVSLIAAGLQLQSCEPNEFQFPSKIGFPLVPKIVSPFASNRTITAGIESHSNKGGPIEVHHLLVLRSDRVLERDCSGGNWTLEQMVKEFLRSQKLGTLGI